MTADDGRPGTALRAAAAAALGLGVAAGAAGVTLISQGMRSVLAVGGSCADGGPYVSAQPCPDGSGSAIFLGVLLGLMALLGTAWGSTTLELPQPIVLLWPALFLTLGWNFLDTGWIDPPAEAGGPIGGLIVCGIVFVLIGLGPLPWARRWMASERCRHRWLPPVVVAYAGLQQRLSSAQLQRAAWRTGSTAGGPERVDDDTALDGTPLADRLQQLAELRAVGALSDEEFQRAKAATLREDSPR